MTCFCSCIDHQCKGTLTKICTEVRNHFDPKDKDVFEFLNTDGMSASWTDVGF